MSQSKTGAICLTMHHSMSSHLYKSSFYCPQLKGKSGVTKSTGQHSWKSTPLSQWERMSQKLARPPIGPDKLCSTMLTCHQSWGEEAGGKLQLWGVTWDLPFKNISIHATSNIAALFVDLKQESSPGALVIWGNFGYSPFPAKMGAKQPLSHTQQTWMPNFQQSPMLGELKSGLACLRKKEGVQRARYGNLGGSGHGDNLKA